MRKAVLTIIVLCVAGYFTSYFVNKKDLDIKLEYFLPPDTLAFVHQKNMQLSVDRLYESYGEKSIIRVDLEKIFREFGVQSSVVDKIIGLNEYVSSIDFQYLYDEFFSREFSLALLPAKDKEDFSRDTLLRSLLLLCKNKHKSRVDQFFLRLYGDSVDISSSNYGNYIVKRIKYKEKVEIFLVSIQSESLVAFDKRTLYAALDRFDDKKRNLYDSTTFSELRTLQDNPHLFIYADIEAIYDKVREGVNEKSAPAKRFTSLWQNLIGFSSAAVSVTSETGLAEIATKVFFDTEILSKRGLKFFLQEPELDENVTFAPPDTLLYYWSNTFDLSSMWQIYRDESEENEGGIAENKLTLEMMTGEELTELISLFGNKIHIVMRKNELSDVVPIPHFALLFETKDRSELKRILNDFFTQNGIPHGRELYNNIECIYWGEGKQEGLQPVFGFLGDNLMVASSVDMCQSVIAASKGKRSLVKTKNFDLLGQNFSSSSNSLCFIQFKDLVDIAKSFISWWSTVTAIQDQENSKRSKRIIYNLINPL